MHNGMLCDLIQSQGQGHKTLKLRNSSIFFLNWSPLPLKMGAGKWPLIIKLGHNIWICSGRIFDICPSRSRPSVPLRG